MSNKKCYFILLALSFFICSMFGGCDYMLKDSGKSDDSSAVCNLDVNDVTKFTLKNQGYRILDEQVSEDKIGRIAGHIRKIAAINKNGKIVNQEKAGAGMIKKLSEIKKKSPDAAAILSFLNVYKSKTSDSFLIVDVDGSYRKAVLSENANDKEKFFNYKSLIEGGDESDEFTLNKSDATQLCCSGRVYQVTDSTILENRLGQYLDCIAESVTFDVKKKKPLTKKELSDIDINGTKQAKENRRSWTYTDVYEIQDISVKNAVAVRINDKFYIAKKK